MEIKKSYTSKLQYCILYLLFLFFFHSYLSAQPVYWVQRSTINNDIPVSEIGRQVGTLIFDIDKDGYNDFVISSYSDIVWYRYVAELQSWEKYYLGSAHSIEAGGDYYDIDDDGDLDIVQGDHISPGELWWWENPYPDVTAQWTRHNILEYGSQHHDQLFGDFDNDGKAELAFFDSYTIYLAEIPPGDSIGSWNYYPIAQLNGTGKPEGLAKGDVNLDGKLDLIGAGWWFEHISDTNFIAHPVNISRQFSRSVVGDLIQGGRPEIVISSGDDTGPLELYEWIDTTWVSHTLIPTVDHGHSLQIADINGDGYLDIFNAEMYDPGSGENCKSYMLFGDGEGNFTIKIINTGIGNHESRIGDLDGDGDLDILGKDFQHDKRIDIWLNNGTNNFPSEWERIKIGEFPSRALFIKSSDIDNDGKTDLVAGRWWWQNPGIINDHWIRYEIGTPLNNTIAVYDFDNDGDIDILGTQGKSSTSNHNFAWARNDGTGNFTVLTNINTGGSGDFVQGCQVADFGTGAEVVISWHNGGGGVHKLTVPENPDSMLWAFDTLSTVSQDEDLSVGDIDNDGDNDLLLGTVWLENTDSIWIDHEIGTIDTGKPDRNSLVDIDSDGDLDAVLGLENSADIFWFEAPQDPKQSWIRHKIAVVEGQGFSMDVADFDSDSDPDIVIGEHRGAETNRVLVFENIDNGSFWIEHEIDNGPTTEIDHHAGTQVVDIDNDSKPDIISIGWYNTKVWLYENQSIQTVIKPLEPATTPYPADNATGVSIKTTLSWKAANTATSHDVYFGPEPVPGLDEFRENQNHTTFNPGILSYGTTYFWRIDELNTTETTTGNIWNFTTELPPEPPEQALNPVPVDSSDNIQTGIILSWTPGMNATSHNIYFGTDPVLDSTEFKNSQTDTTFTPGTLMYGTTYYWRIDETNISGTAPGKTWSFTIKPAPLPPGQASNPNPAHNTDDVKYDITLSWTADSNATSHDVYFGTDSIPDSSEFQGNQTDTTFTPARLTYGVNYYWRIDERNDTGVTMGDVWKFTVELPVNDDLIAYWALDESTGDTVADISGNGHTGILQNQPEFNEGQINNCISLDGVNDRIFAGNFDITDVSGMTISAWIKIDDFDVHDARIISKAVGVYDEDHYWMLSTIRSKGQKLRFRLKTTSGGTSTLIANSGNLSTGVWTHVAATWDGRSMRLYKDGISVGSRNKDGELLAGENVDVAIGNQPAGAGLRPFDGCIDDIRIYKRALTRNEIKELINENLKKPVNIEPDAELSENVSPQNFALYQNYPNPFNNETVIDYQLPEQCLVRLEIYDMLGHKIESLVQGTQAAGIYSVRWNATDEYNKTVPSGIYFYRIKATGTSNTFNTSRKLLLLK